MGVFTVESTMPTGKTHEQFGQEFYVKFKESPQAFPLWFKNAPEVGHEINGEIVNGKFKKEKKEWKPNQAPTTAESKTAPAAGRKYVDNSDGQRQGMCLNNAANFVNTIDFRQEDGTPKILTDKEWADVVHSYAAALYQKGDLPKTPEGSQENPFEDA